MNYTHAIMLQNLKADLVDIDNEPAVIILTCLLAYILLGYLCWLQCHLEGPCMSFEGKLCFLRT